LQEASLVSDINIFAFETLIDVVKFLEDTSIYNNFLDIYKDNNKISRDYLLDLKMFRGKTLL
jgi:magnesium chelatase family protein